MAADHAVALVVEHDRDNVGALAHRRLDLGQRHPHAAITDERHDTSLAMDERRRQGRWEGVAHGTRGRAKEGPGPAEPEPAGGPTGERARVRGQDRVLGQQAPEVGDDPSRVDPRPGPRRVVDDRGRLPGLPVQRVVAVSGEERLREQDEELPPIPASAAR